MKNISKISGFSVFLLLFCLSSVVGAVYYDAETNSYIYENEETEITEIVVEEDAVESENTEEAGTGDVVETETTVEDTTETSSIPTESVNFSGPLEYLHRELVNHKTEVLKNLQEQYYKLRTTLGTLKGGATRLETLQCLGLIPNQENLSEELKTAYENLGKDIKALSADLHNNIDALESKINQKLLDGLPETLEIAGIQNKVDAYLSEYTNMVNMFVELMEAEITNTDAALENASEKSKLLLAAYDKRVRAYDLLQKDYEEFIEKSSFAGALVGPNFPDVASLVNALRAYYTSVFAEKRFDDVTVYLPRHSEGRRLAESEYAIAIDSFERQLDKQIHKIIGDLYPVESLQLINKSIITLRSTYVGKDGAYDCVAFSKNKTLDLAVPALEGQMKKLLEELEVSAKKIALDGKLPRNLEDLKKGLLEGLSETMKNTVDDITAQYKESLTRSFSEQSITMLSYSLLSESDKREQIVRTFLQKKYYEGLHGEKLAKFIEKLEKAEKKIEKALPKATGKTKRILEVIKKVIKDFL